MHKAFIAKIDRIEEVAGANTIQKAYVLGTQLIVSKESKVGDIGILFPSELQLSEDYCKNNNLFRHSNLNLDSAKTGFFEDNRRVRSQIFLKVKSDGYFAPIESLSYLAADLSKLKVGDQFDEINGVKICEKYLSKRTQEHIAGNKIKKPISVVAPFFLPHVDTEQFKYYVDAIPKDALITISSKSHGCVDKNTVIKTLEFGDKTIKEIVDNKIKCSVLSYDIVKNKDIFAPIDDFYFLPNSDDWYEIELEDGTKLEITGNNPIWLPGFKCYRRADKLKIGDFLQKNN